MHPRRVKPKRRFTRAREYQICSVDVKRTRPESDAQSRQDRSTRRPPTKPNLRTPQGVWLILGCVSQTIVRISARHVALDFATRWRPSDEAIAAPRRLALGRWACHVPASAMTNAQRIEHSTRLIGEALRGIPPEHDVRAENAILVDELRRPTAPMEAI